MALAPPDSIGGLGVLFQLDLMVGRMLRGTACSGGLEWPEYSVARRPFGRPARRRATGWLPESRERLWPGGCFGRRSLMGTWQATAHCAPGLGALAEDRGACLSGSMPTSGPARDALLETDRIGDRGRSRLVPVTR